MVLNSKLLPWYSFSFNPSATAHTSHHTINKRKQDFTFRAQRKIKYKMEEGILFMENWHMASMGIYLERMW
jgi:hypothetical protein